MASEELVESGEYGVYKVDRWELFDPVDFITGNVLWLAKKISGRGRRVRVITFKNTPFPSREYCLPCYYVHNLEYLAAGDQVERSILIDMSAAQGVLDEYRDMSGVLAMLWFSVFRVLRLYVHKVKGFRPGDFVSMADVDKVLAIDGALATALRSDISDYTKASLTSELEEVDAQIVARTVLASMKSRADNKEQIESLLPILLGKRQQFLDNEYWWALFFDITLV